MEFADVKCHELAPLLSISNLQFIRKENIDVGGVVFDLKSHRCYVGGLNTLNVPNRDLPRRLAGNAKESCDEEEESDQTHTGNDGLRSHTKSIVASASISNVQDRLGVF